MSVPEGFLASVTQRYLNEELTRTQAIDLLMDTLDIHGEGAVEILDGAVEDMRFFYEDEE